MEAYAGYFYDEKKLKESSSGGVATAVSEAIIKKGGVVYGAIYSEDFSRAEYGCAETLEELEKFKGSKYIFVHKYIVKEGKAIPVYKHAIEQLKRGRLVLFVGLGCDLHALHALAQKENVDVGSLYTIELLCDGVTSAKVHQDYLAELEKMHNSKVVYFTTRCKRDGWIQLYIYAKFENGEEHISPFFASNYGYAFTNYKRKTCYDCKYRNENHPGDLIVADYWGCKPGMKEYNSNGVSLFLVMSDKGKDLVEFIDLSQFYMIKTDVEYALYHSPRYTTSHPKFDKWDIFDSVIREQGLREAVKQCSGISMPERFCKNRMKGIVIWGTGACFRKHISDVRYICPVNCAIDSNDKKWGKEVIPGVVCNSPEVLKENKDVFVLIMIENASIALQIANYLLDIGITNFDHIHNWRVYADSHFLGKYDE